MGRGDSKTRKGKIKSASYGNVRPHQARVKNPRTVKIKKTPEQKAAIAAEMAEKPVTSIKKSHAGEKVQENPEDKKIANA